MTTAPPPHPSQGKNTPRKPRIKKQERTVPLETVVPTVTPFQEEAHREMMELMKQFHGLQEWKKTFPLYEKFAMRAYVNSKAVPSGIPTRSITGQVYGYAQRSPNVWITNVLNGTSDLEHCWLLL